MADYKYPGVYIEEKEVGAKPIAGVPTSIAGFVGKTEIGDEHIGKPTFITSWSDFVKEFGRYTQDAPYMAPAVYGFFINGGRQCYVVKVGDDNYIGTDGEPGQRTGVKALNEVDEVSIVCIPGITDTLVQQTLLSECENMKDRVCIFDPEQGASFETVKQQVETVISKAGYAALYYPWVEAGVEIEVNGNVSLEKMLVPPSGYVSGVYSRTDNTRGVHKAPANESLKGVTGLERKISNDEQGTLNPNGVNCIRSFPGKGILVWGARSTAGDNSNWKYINVRRLFLFIEESIEEATQDFVFEPNDKRLWDRVKQTIVQFLTRVWRDGALMGNTPEEAFFVKCDQTTMTQDDIDNGRLICLIGVAPVKPAEFVIFRIAQTKSGAQLTEF